MGFDIRAATVRLSNRGAERRDSIYSIDQAVNQFNGLLKAAKNRYPDRVDIQGLLEFKSINEVKPQLLKDAIQRLIDALDVEPDAGGDAEPLLSPKFGMLRAESQLEADFSAYVEDHGGLGLLFFDIDHFKKLNTKYTETIVDREVLVPLQRFLLNAIQSRGLGYSVGGDEFIVLLRNADSTESKAFADRLLQTVSAYAFNIGGNKETLTLSIGLACFPSDSKILTQLREMANKAENLAKSTGRNKVVCWHQIEVHDGPKKTIQQTS